MKRLVVMLVLAFCTCGLRAACAADINGILMQRISPTTFRVGFQGSGDLAPDDVFGVVREGIDVGQVVLVQYHDELVARADGPAGALREGDRVVFRRHGSSEIRATQGIDQAASDATDDDDEPPVEVSSAASDRVPCASYAGFYTVTYHPHSVHHRHRSGSHRHHH